MPIFSWMGRWLKPGRPLLDDEGGDALLLLGRSVERQHHEDVADGALGDEGLGAVEHPAVALAHGAWSSARRRPSPSPAR